MAKEICIECKYGLEDNTNNGVYRSCHRYPKVEQVQATSFCGEFKSKPKPKAKKETKN